MLIDFCSPVVPFCESMHGNLRTIRSSFSEDELVIISIFIGATDTVEDIRQFKEQHGGNWTYAKDMGVHVLYGLSYVPTEFVVDVNGYIISEHEGVAAVGVLSDDIEDAKDGYEQGGADELDEPGANLYLVIILVIVIMIIVVILLISMRQQQERSE